MASAQVLPNSMASTRKLEHLEAGKRRLEEFRKKKAAERIKKTAPPSQNHISDGGSQEKKPLESEHAQRITDSDGATTTNGAGRSAIESSSALVKVDRHADSFSQNMQNTLNERHANYPFTRNNDGAFSADPVKQPSTGQEIKTFNGPRLSGTTDVNSRNEILEINKDARVSSGSQARISFGSASGISRQASEETDSIFNQSTPHGVDGLLYRDSQENSIQISGPLHSFSANSSPQNTVSNLQDTDSSSNNILASGHSFSSSYDGFFNSTTKKGYSSHEVGENVHRTFEIIDNQTSDLGQRKPIDVTDFTRTKPANMQSSEFAGWNTDFRSPSNYEPPYTTSSENSFRRSRPSFLDSLTVPKASSGSFLGHAEHDKGSRISDGFKANEKDAPVSFSFQNPIQSDGFRSDERDGSESLSFQKPLMGMKTVGTSSGFASQNTPVPYINSFPPSVFAGKGVDQGIIGIEDNTMERKFYSAKQNEDFSALEQHIEDLTQEKFSLQRALEASRTLAESLAAENSSLTDSYNKQRSVVNQLKSDMEMLQEEMKTQMVELESIKHEYTIAQLECNAADERAKLIASEVIGLEEKALRLRSNELKLERQLENLEAQISLYKKKMSSMEKERHDFQSTIDALQEEKKLLQSKLRKASTSGKSIDISNTSNRKDMATSMEDLVNTDASSGTSNLEVKDEASSSGAPMLLENVTTEVSSAIVPPDHMRMIQNINALIAELAVEKEELTQALASELASSSKLKELNKELSRKLETQTQRLELLTAQRMAGEIVPVRQPDSRTMHDEDIALADEGDEVVERVLGWIMKLFPGGPTRRRTSKLL